MQQAIKPTDDGVRETGGQSRGAEAAMMAATLPEADADVAACVAREHTRQGDHLDFIASENITSQAVMEAQGSVFTNKYAEGYIGRRYYGGCEEVDGVERLAEERLKQLFGCAHANVQPHSGSSANLAVFFALMQPGDTFMALSLNEGGHLTHGAPVNFSGKWFVPAPYGLNPKTHLIDMDEVRRVALASRPKMIIAGLTAYPRALDFAAFRAIADEVGAYLMVDMAHIAGLVATGLHASPFPHAHVVTSTTHKTLRGPRGGIILTNEDVINKKIRMAVFPGLQGGPLMHVIAAKAVAFGQALSPTFGAYMKRVVANARALGDALQREGLSLLTGGTDNHMVLVDLRSLGISGQEAEAVLETCGLICNKNTVPGETRPPREASGLRLGTPAATTRGLTEDDCRAVGSWIATLLTHKARGEEATVLSALKEKVAALARVHPLPY